jgi:two-component system chemotaxis response regulator CheB
MWAAVRALHEQERLFTKMRERALESRAVELAVEYLAKAEQARVYAQSLRDIITTRVLVVPGK